MWPKLKSMKTNTLSLNEAILCFFPMWSWTNTNTLWRFVLLLPWNGILIKNQDTNFWCVKGVISTPVTSLDSVFQQRQWPPNIGLDLLPFGIVCPNYHVHQIHLNLCPASGAIRDRGLSYPVAFTFNLNKKTRNQQKNPCAAAFKINPNKETKKPIRNSNQRRDGPMCYCLQIMSKNLLV